MVAPYQLVACAALDTEVPTHRRLLPTAKQLGDEFKRHFYQTILP